ncbi:MAG: class I SAM-dependent methyltransferase [Planctomycetes bacterium]|nr:class I SAM-dependent methyltransferase [Planctomycetota bacterium]
MTSVWDLRALLYDVCEGSQLRRGAAKARLFAQMHGQVLFLAVGTGVDINRFPTGQNIIGIDISHEMLRRAETRRRAYCGQMAFVLGDAERLAFGDESFDTVVSSCTMCSVPQPVVALKELHRVLRPGGRLLMFEHVRSRSWSLGLALDLMTLWTRLLGTEMNRDTVANVRTAGFDIVRIESVYLDIILSIHAVKKAA